MKLPSWHRTKANKIPKFAKYTMLTTGATGVGAGSTAAGFCRIPVPAVVAGARVTLGAAPSIEAELD